MNCLEVQKRLSLFYDNRLSQDEVARVAAHVADCSPCAEELASFEQLSGLSQQMTDPQAPAHLWDELQSKLNQPVEREAVPGWDIRNHVLTRRLALAATILIAVGLGSAGYQAWFSHGHDQLAVNFARYLENFPEQPVATQKIFLANYDGRPTTLAEAENVLGYKPAAAKGLPAGYSVKEVHLLTMPCCTCAQVICTNEAGQSIAIFEHAMDQPVWFGDRPVDKCVCDEMPTNVVRVGDRLAATWKEGKRHITIIGATDLDEVTEFVAHFKGTSAS
ncbi:MAG: hypothetical protein GXP26_01805 [Planctomycetes bacterium]|nr:hypothetical protein [Planctomycetota bacterium]